MLGKFESKVIEEKILDWWERENIYRDIKNNEPKDKVWRFIDGPPYTTGDIHMGTALNKILTSAGTANNGCGQLKTAHKRVDGNPEQPDWVEGPAASGVATAIQNVMIEMGCN